ncbi:hypothetical protein BI375_21115 [Vibrio rotiferianus]|uniref:Uncharacterized protein n=1 Tax=Vibrio rotiferianus TaxID=190895 RepID=A0ABX3D6W3_9VIBR|nr:hypothetical protein [Vibrio rotiferianus]OHY92116.1 hypothetical protein BI375_21115 [Vibrio rotiferianus]
MNCSDISSIVAEAIQNATDNDKASCSIQFDVNEVVKSELDFALNSFNVLKTEARIENGQYIVDIEWLKE